MSTRQHDGREAKVVVLHQTFDTDIDDVWDACTNAERIPRWFLPVSGDLRLGAVGVGWDLALLGLRSQLSGAPAVDPQHAQAWQVSDEGRDFMTRSSQARSRASVHSGTDEAAARAAETRTTAAYTGSDPGG